MTRFLSSCTFQGRYIIRASRFRELRTFGRGIRRVAVLAVGDLGYYIWHAARTGVGVNRVESKSVTRIIEYKLFWGITWSAFQDVDRWWAVCKQAGAKCPNSHEETKIKVYEIKGRAVPHGESNLYPGGMKGKGLIVIGDSINKMVIDRRVRAAAPSVCERLNNSK